MPFNYRRTCNKNFAEVRVENIKQWRLRQTSVPTKAGYILIYMILNIRYTKIGQSGSSNDQKQSSNNLIKVRLFFKDMEKTFSASKPNCEGELNDNFFNTIRDSRESGFFFVDREAIKKNKRQLEKASKLRQRKHNEKQRKMDSESSFLVWQSHDNKSNLSSDAGGEILTLACLKPKTRKQIHKKQPAVNLNLDPTQWSETASLVVG